jgi:hypothetical protein
MKKSNKPAKPNGDDDVDRRKKLQFKKKKQRQKEQSINYKNIRSLTDLDDYEDEYNF